MMIQFQKNKYNYIIVEEFRKVYTLLKITQSSDLHLIFYPNRRLIYNINFITRALEVALSE